MYLLIFFYLFIRFTFYVSIPREGILIVLFIANKPLEQCLVRCRCSVCVEWINLKLFEQGEFGKRCRIDRKRPDQVSILFQMLWEDIEGIN